MNPRNPLTADDLTITKQINGYPFDSKTTLKDIHEQINQSNQRKVVNIIIKYRTEDGNFRPAQTKTQANQCIYKISKGHWILGNNIETLQSIGLMLILRSMAKQNMSRIREILWAVEW